MNISQINKIRIPQPSRFGISYNLINSKKLNFSYIKVVLSQYKNCLRDKQSNVYFTEKFFRYNSNQIALKLTNIKYYKFVLVIFEFLLRVKDNTE